MGNGMLINHTMQLSKLIKLSPVADCDGCQLNLQRMPWESPTGCFSWLLSSSSNNSRLCGRMHSFAAHLE